MIAVLCQHLILRSLYTSRSGHVHMPSGHTVAAEGYVNNIIVCTKGMWPDSILGIGVPHSYSGQSSCSWLLLLLRRHSSITLFSGDVIPTPS